MTGLNLPPYFADSLPGRAGWPIGLAHRGADVQRENTLRAVREAVEQGFGYIEIDVRTSADGKVVVFHDEQVAEPLVLFEHLLETFPTARFNVDLKDRASAAPVAEILRRHRAWDRVLIAAFRDSHRRLFFDHLQAEDHTVASSAGSETVAQLLLAHRLGRFTQTVRRLRQRLPLHALQVPVRQGWLRIVTKRFLDACHRESIAVHIWVVNEQEEMERLLEMGVDGFVTDNGAALAEVFETRGQWPQRP